MTVETLDALIEAELKDVYDTEHRLRDALSELSEQTEHDEIAEAFSEHEEQTETHIDRLEQVFEAIGSSPERDNCQGIEGIIEEHESFVEEKEPSKDILDRYNVGAAQKSERYEITAYENLIQWAQKAGLDDAIEPLEENLREEKETLDKLQQIAEQFDYEAITA